MPWHDIAILITGSVVNDLARHFRDLWNHSVKDITGSQDNKEVISAPEVNKTPPTSKRQRFINSLFRRKTDNDRQETYHEEKKSSKFANIFKGLVTKVWKDEEESEEANQSATDLQNKFLERRMFEESENLHADSIPEHGFEESKLDKDQSEEKDVTSSDDNVFKLFSQLLKKNLNPQPQARSISEVNIEDQKKKITEEEEIESKSVGGADELKAKMFGGLLNIPEKQSTKEIYEYGTCKCQLTRSCGMWSFGRKPTETSVHSAYMHLISSAEHFIYIENQFFISNTAGDPVNNLIAEALINRILNAIKRNSKFKVIVVIPLLPGFEGAVDDSQATVLRVQLHWEYHTISRGASSIYEQLKEKVENPEDYIKFYSLRTHDLLKETPVTEMIYIHSKLMIVDDQRMIVGSANINDRSMNGDRDSEVAMVVSDNKKVKSKMVGFDIGVSEFCHSLRINIFKEHSGCEDLEILKDPFTPEFEEV